MCTVRLVCWNEEQAEQKSRMLRSAGYTVVADSLEGMGGIIRHFRDLAPAAVIIDLDRLPSHGREVAVMLRGSKSTRHLPLLFAGGAAEKVERVRRELPDAVYAAWAEITSALPRALREAPAKPLRPTPHMERWKDRELTRKLGITAANCVALIVGDDTLRELLSEVPEGIRLDDRISGETNLALYLARSARELAFAVEQATARLPAGGSYWIVYPKKSGRIRCDFTEHDVRALALARGWVDYKVCAVDADWTGLKFARRRKR